VDYAHNVPAFKALNQVVTSLCENRPQGHRRFGVVSGTGNRMDDDIRSLGEAAAGIYSDLIIKDSDPRGRKVGETAEIMKSGALDAGFPAENLTVVFNEVEAINMAISAARPGDLVVIQPDDITGVIELLLKHKENLVSLDPGEKLAG